MLHRTLRIAIPYAQELEQRGIALGLNNQSHLSPLLTTSFPDNPKPQTDPTDFVTSVENATMIQGMVTEYENFAGGLVDSLRPLVQSHIANSRIVGGMCRTFVDIVNRYLEAGSVGSASDNFNIVKDDIGDLFDIPSVRGSFENSSEPMTMPQVDQICAGGRDSATLLNYVLTGNPRMDAAIQGLVSQFGDNFLESIWYGLFTSIDPNTPYRLEKISLLPPGEKLCVSYLGYLMANHLHGAPTDDACGGLVTYQRNLETLMSFLLNVAGRAFDQREQMITKKVVVLSYNADSRTVVVNGPVYRQWLENGGSPDIIFGCLLSDRQSFSEESLATSSENYLSIWNNYCSFHNLEADVKRTRYARSVIKVAMSEHLCEQALIEEKYRQENPNFAEYVIRETEKYVDGLSISDFDNLDKIALDLVAGIRFGYTPSKFILEYMDRDMKKNPEKDPRESALIAACIYMAEYQVGQVAYNKL